MFVTLRLSVADAERLEGLVKELRDRVGGAAGESVTRAGVLRDLIRRGFGGVGAALGGFGGVGAALPTAPSPPAAVTLKHSGEEESRGRTVSWDSLEPSVTRVVDEELLDCADCSYACKKERYPDACSGYTNDPSKKGKVF